jgi:hypothetical protein
MKVNLLSIAKCEVEEAIDDHEERRAGLGQEFVLAFEKTLTEIRLFPQLGSKMDANWRRRRLKNFPYGVIFRVHEGAILVLAVMHLARKPGYRKARIKEIE